MMVIDDTQDMKAIATVMIKMIQPTVVVDWLVWNLSLQILDIKQATMAEVLRDFSQFLQERVAILH
jgi:hypothetical protein